jgi:hypothetical protein
MGRNDTIELLGVVERETPKAILFRNHGWENAQWIPTSQIKNSQKTSPDSDELAIEVAGWLAEKNDWEPVG